MEDIRGGVRPLAAQRDLRGGFSVAGNLGVDFDPAAVLTFATLTAAYDITGRLGTFAELVGSAGGRSPSLLADGGFTYLLAENLQMDVSGGMTLFDVGPSWFIGAGFAVRFPR